MFRRMDRDRKYPAALVPSEASACVARLERALVLAAYVVLRHGDVYAPYLDRLEKELEAARADDPAARAKAVLDRYLVPVEGFKFKQLPADAASE